MQWVTGKSKNSVDIIEPNKSNYNNYKRTKEILDRVEKKNVKANRLILQPLPSKRMSELEDDKLILASENLSYGPISPSNVSNGTYKFTSRSSKTSKTSRTSKNFRASRTSKNFRPSRTSRNYNPLGQRTDSGFRPSTTSINEETGNYNMFGKRVSNAVNRVLSKEFSNGSVFSNEQLHEKKTISNITE